MISGARYDRYCAWNSASAQPSLLGRTNPTPGISPMVITLSQVRAIQSSRDAGFGVVGGIYGIGGGSILGPILAGRGILVAEVAPAALASTFMTSITGALTYAVLALIDTGGSIAPDWPLGLLPEGVLPASRASSRLIRIDQLTCRFTGMSRTR